MTREHKSATDDLFRQEAQEFLNAIQDALLDLFATTADQSDLDRRLDEVLSNARSLRGEAEVAQWRGVVKLSQRLEENLQRIRLYRPELGLKFQNLWRQALSALQAAIVAQEESPFADRLGVEAAAAAALDRLELHFAEAPVRNENWAELEHTLQLLESLWAGWQEVAEAQTDLAAVQESLAELGNRLPGVAAIGQWLEEASGYVQDLAGWQDLGEQTIRRLQEILGIAGADTSTSGSQEHRPFSSLPDMRDLRHETTEPFAFPEVNDTELFAREDDAAATDPFPWSEPTAATSTHFSTAGMNSAPARGEDFFGGLSDFSLAEEPDTNPEGNFWSQDTSAAPGASELFPAEIQAEPVGNAFFTEESKAEGLVDLNFWEDTEVNFTTEGETFGGLANWEFSAESAATNPGNFAAETETVEALRDFGFAPEPEARVELAPREEIGFTDTETGAEEALTADWSLFPEPATPPEAPEKFTAEPVLAEALETL
ncbi:MAG: hypothetical protein SNJ60_04155, partial [Pseudanabaenaceae cyanobacterium]